MITVFDLLGLTVGVGFAFFAPVFFTSLAEKCALMGYPEGKRLLPGFFKVGSWVFLLASNIEIAALLFANEGRVESAITAVITLVVAWRFWRSGRKGPPNRPHCASLDIT